MLLDGFKDPLIIILSVAAVLSLIIGVIKTEFMEPIGIIAAIALAVGIGFWNTYSASKKFDLLLNYADDTKVKTYRDGSVVEVKRRALVTGDVIILESGEEVPADVRVLEGYCSCDESSFTGESRPVRKEPYTNLEGTTYPANEMLRGSVLIEGRVECVVEKIGDNTVLGGMARQASEITDTETPLNKQLDRLASLINKIAFWSAGILITALVVKYTFIDQAYVGKETLGIVNDLLQFLMIAVALIVVAVPEGLPMAVTLALAYSMKKMANENNLIKKMHACETLGATTLILTDKTGTLTENKMTVVFKSVNIGYNDIVLNSTAFGHVGNPTEQALIRSLGTTDESIQKTRAKYPVVYSEEFNSDRKYMKSVYKAEDGRYIVLVKGAPEIVNGFCIKDRSDSYKVEQSRGRRVIGFAIRVDETTDALELNENFEYLGHVSIEDPVRSNVPNAIKQAREAGIKVKIVTGDNAETAAEIARQAKISDYPQVVLGKDVPNVNLSIVDKADVFARTKPEDKQLLVKKFQALGEVVAMTGDGTNDAPALNHAEVGIAMNNGTDVAKEAADVVLLDNSFPSIITGIKWGRSLYKNIQHFILFQLTINVVAILTAIVGPFIGVNLPFTVTQMLWVNLIMDTFAALALATEPANDAVMLEKPRNPKAFIITTDMWLTIGGVGIVFFVLMVALLVTNYVNLTQFFTIFVMLQWWNLFNARVFGQDRSIFDGLGQNWAFTGITLVILLGQFLIVQFGGEMFRTEPLSLAQWLCIIGGTSLVAVFGEGLHWIKKIIC
jgi:Ca2+-transporting ATPase